MKQVLTKEFEEMVLKNIETIVSDALVVTVKSVQDNSVNLEFAICGSNGQPLVLLTDIATLWEGDKLTVAEIHKAFNVKRVTNVDVSVSVPSDDERP